MDIDTLTKIILEQEEMIEKLAEQNRKLCELLALLGAGKEAERYAETISRGSGSTRG